MEKKYKRLSHLTFSSLCLPGVISFLYCDKCISARHDDRVLQIIIGSFNHSSLWGIVESNLLFNYLEFFFCEFLVIMPQFNNP